VTEAAEEMDVERTHLVNRINKDAGRAACKAHDAEVERELAKADVHLSSRPVAKVRAAGGHGRGVPPGTPPAAREEATRRVAAPSGVSCACVRVAWRACVRVDRPSMGPCAPTHAHVCACTHTHGVPRHHAMSPRCAPAPCHVTTRRPG
jgi:hypothetical protein